MHRSTIDWQNQWQPSHQPHRDNQWWQCTRDWDRRRFTSEPRNGNSKTKFKPSCRTKNWEQKKFNFLAPFATRWAPRNVVFTYTVWSKQKSPNPGQWRRTNCDVWDKRRKIHVGNPPAVLKAILTSETKFQKQTETLSLCRSKFNRIFNSWPRLWWTVLHFTNNKNSFERNVVVWKIIIITWCQNPLRPYTRHFPASTEKFD